MIPKNLKQLFQKIVKIVKPPPELTVSEWADQNRYLISSSSAEPGRWRTDRVPYIREIMDCLSANSPVQDICFKKGAQVAGSEGGNNWIGYIIDLNPGPTMLVQPTVDTAKNYSQKRIAPMIAASPALRKKVRDSKSRDSGNKTLSKEFPGGFLIITGANSAAGLRSNPIKNLFLDEIDAYVPDVDGEGDPVDLAFARTRTFSMRKVFKVSTPTTTEESRIEVEYEASDKRKYFVPCPQCETMHVLEWCNFKIPKDEHGRYIPEDAYMVCMECGGKIEEHHKTWMFSNGEWRATAPENSHPKRRGYHLSALYSSLGIFSWAECAEEWIKAQKSKKRLKVFVNTILGECYEEERGDELEHEVLAKRKEEYACLVPENVLVLTAGVDVQDDRLEVEVVGWGVGKESWGIEYRRFIGKPDQATVWEDLDAYLKREFKQVNGTVLKIACCCIDSGGHFTREVYKFTKPREYRRVFAIKGRGGAGIPYIGRHSRNNSIRAALIPIGVDEGKETLWNRLKVEAPGEGYCHFPIALERGYDELFFKGLTAERRILTHEKGRPVMVWRRRPGSTKRNEPLDIRNYATAALEIYNPNLEQIAAMKEADEPKQPVAVSIPRRRRNGVVKKGMEY